MNPFLTFRELQRAYGDYVNSFQIFKKNAIRDWVNAKTFHGHLLWKNPFIRLNPRFERGEALNQLVSMNILHKDVPECFTVDAGNPNAPVIHPHKHQTLAIRQLLEKKVNTIVATGTGSGKSFCFGIPIISTCLKMRDEGRKGIKAIIIYPMNALANSQYEDFAYRLQGTGLKLMLYTGDTDSDYDEALNNMKTLLGREPFDSEVISREEVRSKNIFPDILMTNYTMLELLLTRLEDKKLFPEEHKGILKFLVLDEIHTYTGKRGADVACLIRRLKQHTGTIENLRCIGTSATVHSDTGQSGADIICEFASNLFGEVFDKNHVIGEHYLKLPSITPVALPPDILITKNMIEDYDGSLDKAIIIVEALIGRTLNTQEKTHEAIGQILKDHPTLHFLEEKLNASSQPINQVVEEYGKIFRPGCLPDTCQLELEGAILAGMSAHINIYGKLQPRFVPKLHTFFSQGKSISSCLYPKKLHLDEKGEMICSTCANEKNIEIMTYPLQFCRACGQEFYRAILTNSRELYPISLDIEQLEGEKIYVFRDEIDLEQISFPDNWYKKSGEIKAEFEGSIPEKEFYCPLHNKIKPDCNCKEIYEFYYFKEPLLICPSCGVTYDRRSREFAKVFSFGTSGRSTATDVLIAGVMKNLNEKERKIIAFTDNRQDTALQAGHLNNLQRKIFFRQALYQALKEGDYKDKYKALSLNEVGKEVFRVMNKYDKVPKYSKTIGKYRKNPGLDKIYQDYLVYVTAEELMEKSKRTHQNLEDVGLIQIFYDGLHNLANDNKLWNQIPELTNLSVDIREDFLTGFLDIFRKKRSINHPHMLNQYKLENEIISKLEESCLFHGSAYTSTPVGFSDTAISNRNIQVRKITHLRSPLVKWVEVILNVDINCAISIAESLVEILKDPEIGYLVEETVKHFRASANVVMLNNECIELAYIKKNAHKVCSRCNSLYHFEKLDLCVNPGCGRLITKDFQNNYFVTEYTTPLDKIVLLEAQEHSGQVEGKERKNLEARFKDNKDPLNVMVCTPTMEMGIDIGQLSSVYMRNVPPSPSNYAQRAGRAGRKNQPSFVTTFCGSGFKGIHDQYFYRFPEKIVSGKIGAPRFLLDNKILITSHINALVLETIDIKLPSKPAELLNLNDDCYPIEPSFKKI